jgi:CheY-like chemotaxis protein
MKKVLVADDKASGRELLQTVLEQYGYSVFEAGNGLEALRIAREVLPDLIILDLHMPPPDGFGTVSELRLDERFRWTPIVALTASAMQGDRERALSSGFTSYIAKPVSLNVPRREIDRLLGKEHANAANRC